MPAQGFRRLLLSRRLGLVEERVARYRERLPRPEVEAVQLARWNQAWEDARLRFSFYRHWQRTYGLPDRLGSLEELRSFPVLRKRHLQRAAAEIFREAGPSPTVATGGSTGEPLRFPVSRNDMDGFYANGWVGRSWVGARPFDRIVLIWGHAHLLGERPGLARAARSAARVLKDRFVNTVRLDAYRLTRETAAPYLDVLRRNPGAVVLAYASACEKLLDHVEDTGIRRPAWAPTHVILTSERMEPATPERIRELWGSLPVIEYGTGELGVVAYSTTESLALRLLWGSFHGRIGEEDELVVTTLDRRLFPLIHYGTGDRLAGADDPDAVLSCREVLGRRNDAVRIPVRAGGSVEVHSELLTHAVRTTAGVRAFLVVEHAREGRLELRLLTEPSELERAGRRAVAALTGEVPDLDPGRIQVSLLREEPLTLAGKRKFVERVGPTS